MCVLQVPEYKSPINESINLRFSYKVSKDTILKLVIF